MAKKYIVTVNGTSYEVVVEDADPNASYTKAPETPKKHPKRLLPPHPQPPHLRRPLLSATVKK